MHQEERKENPKRANSAGLTNKSNTTLVLGSQVSSCASTASSTASSFSSHAPSLKSSMESLIRGEGFKVALNVIIRISRKKIPVSFSSNVRRQQMTDSDRPTDRNLERHLQREIGIILCVLCTTPSVGCRVQRCDSCTATFRRPAASNVLLRATGLYFLILCVIRRHR